MQEPQAAIKSVHILLVAHCAIHMDVIANGDVLRAMGTMMNGFHISVPMDSG